MNMTLRAGVRRWLLGASLTFATVAGAAEPSGLPTPDRDRSKPVLELLFDGNLTDSSEAKRLCTAQGPVAFVDGRRGQCASLDGRFRPRGAVGMKYAFRSTSMGAPEWFLDAPNGGNGSEPWTREEKDTVQACVATYKAKLRPLVRAADLYHILPRPNGRTWDGIEYYDPAAGKGVIYLFKPAAEPLTEPIRFKGLDARAMYRVSFEDGTQPPSVKSASELMDPGLTVTLPGAEASELIFFEAMR